METSLHPEAVSGLAGCGHRFFRFRVNGTGIRAVPEYDLRKADVAYIASHRVPGGDVEDHFLGAPDLVIEVLSPSNTTTEIFDKETLCLENEASEFWVVDPSRQQVRVSTPDRRTVAYRAGEEITLPMFGGSKLRVNAIFDLA